jgi:formylglycine-generating enzyme required for sulfatase activity
MIIEPECSGIWHGDWIDCGEDLCPQPGACCFLGETCQLLALDDCAAAGGFFRGENIPCDPGRCSGVGVVELDGAARDPLYEAGIPLAVQIKQTGYGDSTLGRPDWANGSELDAAYGVVYDGNLYLVLAGNLQTNGNTVEIFFDTRPGGQNRLLGTENSDIDYGALRRMGYLDEVSPGLKFAAGFEADYYLTLKANGAPTAVYASYAELYVDALNPGMGSYLGEGRTKCETNDGTLTGGWEGAPAVRCTLDNSNVAGVTGGFGLGDGTGVLTGFELVIPLSAIGSPTSDFAVTVFINSPGHDWVSNQTLGGIAASSPGNLGEPRTLDLEAFGQVPFTVPITPTPVGACCIGTVCSIQTQTACAGAGGVYAGDNASCDGNPCDQVTSGRCCIEDDYSGECLVTTQADCANLGGAYTAGEDCAGCPCLLGPRGACCLNGQCTITRQEDCTASQGVFAGPFSVCDDISCTPGACCIVHDCSALFGFQCSAAGGRYRGDGTTCQEHTCSQTVPTPTVAGTMNGWNTTANPMMETAPNSGIWTVTFSSLLPPGRRDEFKITNGTWSNCIPGSNSWCHTDSNGQVTITYDSNLYADGWAPGWDRIGVSVDSGAWTAAGDWQGWNNANPSTAMVAQGEEGEGIYLYEGTGLEAGKHYWKAVKTGSWDSISWNERSINTADMEFTIGAPTDVFRLWVDALAGRVKVEVWPAQGACCQPNGSCAVTWQADCTGTWHGVGTTCTPTPCPLVNGDLNCDHIVDLNDIPYFTGALLGEYSGCQLGLADMDCDGTVDGLDIAPFVNYLVAGIYPPCTQPPTGMVLIPAGEFLMGDTFTEGDTDEQPVHTVYVDAFHMDTYEVTNHQYCDALNWAYGQGNLIQVTSGVVYQHGGTSYAYCDTTTSSSYSRITWNGTTFGVTAGKANHPMVMVSWYGSVAYANWRSEIQNKPLCYDLSDWTCNFAVAGYRLPTEAEWEKAARGGAAGHRFPWSDQDTIQHARANYYSYAIYGYDTSATRNYHPLWGISPYYPFTSPVGFFTGALRHEADWGWPGSPTSYQTANGANSYGLHDMAGNVWERCNDWYQSDYYSNSPYNDPTGPTSGAYTSRVLRGGGWGSTASGCRVADRYDATPGTRHDTFGFRLALDSP